MKLLATFPLLMFFLSSIGQISHSLKDDSLQVDTMYLYNEFNRKNIDNEQKKQDSYSWNIGTEIKYTYSDEKVVIIQNSGPRGGRGFTDSRGTKFGYRVFCTRVINESATPLELTIIFPTDSFPFPSADSYMKVFLPSDTMKQVKNVLLYDASLKSSYDAATHTTPKLLKTINPNESYLFYIALLRHNSGGGIPRGGFALKGQELFYRNTPEFDTELIPCGHIAFKN